MMMKNWPRCWRSGKEKVMNDSISRQAAIDALNEKCLMPVWCKVLVKKMLTDLPSAEPGWIPVTERLPESDDMMLVTARPKKGEPNVNRAFYMAGSWHGSGSMSNVVAWMPLPEPWKGEEVEKNS